MSNVNPEEIKKFDAIADSWWDVNGSMKPLHLLNPLRLQYIKQRCQLSGARVLDVGCGGGILTESLTQAGGNTTGIDLSDAALEAAKNHAKYGQLTIDYQCISVEKLAEQQGASFDVITCMEMLEHVPEPESVVRACASLLKPGGKVFFSTLNRTPKAFLLAIVAAEYVMQMLPRGTHQYSAFIRPSELEHWAVEAGLDLEDITGLSYSAFTQQFSFVENPAVNYLTCYYHGNLCH